MFNPLKKIFGDSDSEIQALRAENERLQTELAKMRKVAQSSIGADSPLSKTTYSIIKDLLNQIDDASLLLSSDGNVLYANDHFLQQYNLTREELKGKIYDPVFNIVEKDQFERKINQARAGGGKTTYNNVMRRNNGPETSSQISIFIYNLLGRETIWYFSKDNTELSNSRNELRELNYLLNSILDNLPVYLFVKDVDNELRYLYWNKAFAEYSKIPASKVIGKTDFEVFPDYNDAQKFRNDDTYVIQSGEPINRHETYEAADGSTRIVQTQKRLVHRDGRGPLLIGMSMDITNMANIEQELVQERIRAEEADRLKSRFLANMSHEIRTPLNAIVGFSSLLVDTEDPEMRKQFSEIIDQNNEVLLQLINDILDLSKIEAGTLEYMRAPMDLLDTCNNIYEIHKNKMHPGVKLVFDNAEDTGAFIITEDRNRISQVINNLINNATKFTKKGEIRFGFKVEDEWVKVYVKDTGIGIAPDKLSTVFDSFVKLDQFAKGTGLGLAICKLIVETMGGTLNVESEVGKGSTFYFTIPYNEDRKYNNIAEHAEIKMPDNAGYKQLSDRQYTSKSDQTILVAEDVHSNFLYVKALVKDRYTLLWAKDGSEAVRMFKEHNPDLILMDIKMPGMDGMVATSLIRSYSSEVPIIALTANAYDSDRKMALDSGMNDYMSKPIDRAAFERIISEYLD